MRHAIARYLPTAASSFLLLVPVQKLSAQIQTGRIVGTIYDPNKAVVPNATIKVTNKGTTVTQRVVSNETGVFVVPALNPGMYDVTVTASGFRTIARNGIE